MVLSERMQTEEVAKDEVTPKTTGGDTIIPRSSNFFSWFLHPAVSEGDKSLGLDLSGSKCPDQATITTLRELQESDEGNGNFQTTIG
nr:hypothetical protein HmN_000457100 [Hymenolepis microstoma]